MLAHLMHGRKFEPINGFRLQSVGTISMGWERTRSTFGECHLLVSRVRTAGRSGHKIHGRALLLTLRRILSGVLVQISAFGAPQCRTFLTRTGGQKFGVRTRGSLWPYPPKHISPVHPRIELIV